MVSAAVDQSFAGQNLDAGIIFVVPTGRRTYYLVMCSETRALPYVIAGPEWLKIGVVKCEVLLFNVSQIK